MISNNFSLNRLINQIFMVNLLINFLIYKKILVINSNNYKTKKIRQMMYKTLEKSFYKNNNFFLYPLRKKVILLEHRIIEIIIIRKLLGLLTNISLLESNRLNKTLVFN